MITHLAQILETSSCSTFEHIDNDDYGVLEFVITNFILLKGLEIIFLLYNSSIVDFKNVIIL